MDPFLYLDRDTAVHRLDPRTKMFLLVGTFVLAFLFTNPLYGIVVLTVVLAFGAAAKSLANLKRIWFILVMIALVTVVLWSIFGSGQTTLIAFIERESLLYGLGTALRVDTTIIAGMIFLSTTRNEEIAAGLVRLGIPYRFAFAVSTALRLVPTVIGTTNTISQAQRSRGLDLDSGGFVQRIRKFVPLLVPVFVSTVRSTNVFSMALESKGFGAGTKRTFYLDLAFRRSDLITLSVFVVLVVVAIVLRVWGFGGVEGFER